MTAAEIIRQVRSAGGQIAADGADLVLTALRPLPAELLDRLKVHKPEILAALAAPGVPDQAANLREVRTHLSPAALADLPPEDGACPRWRVSIVGPSALNIELEMRSAWTVSDWGRFARRHYGPDATVVARVRPEPEPVTEEGAAQDLHEAFEERVAIQGETSDPGALWWRVAITEPGGRTVEVDTPSGWTLAECTAYAARYHGPGCTVTPIAPLPKPRAATCLIRSTS